VQNNSFSIGGGTSGLKISWQITGIRKDPYAEKNRVKVEENKPDNERGKYLYPEAYGLPKSMGVDFAQPQGQGNTRAVNPAPVNSIEDVRQKDEKIRKAPIQNKGKEAALVLPPKSN
jgi:hypothetical protein